MVSLHRLWACVDTDWGKESQCQDVGGVVGSIFSSEIATEGMTEEMER